VNDHIDIKHWPAVDHRPHRAAVDELTMPQLALLGAVIFLCSFTLTFVLLHLIDF
jgi:hypothetical protein